MLTRSFTVNLVQRMPVLGHWAISFSYTPANSSRSGRMAFLASDGTGSPT